MALLKDPSKTSQALALGALQRRLQQRSRSNAERHPVQAGPQEQQAEGLDTPTEEQEQPPPVAEEDWAAAEPDPLADIQPAPEGAAPVPLLDGELEEEQPVGNMTNGSSNGEVSDEQAASDVDGDPNVGGGGGGSNSAATAAENLLTAGRLAEQAACDAAGPAQPNATGACGGDSAITAPQDPQTAEVLAEQAASCANRLSEPNAAGGSSSTNDSTTRAPEGQLAADPASEHNELPPVVDGGAGTGNSDSVSASDEPSSNDTAEEDEQPATGASEATEQPPAAQHATAEEAAEECAAAEPTSSDSSAAESAAELAKACDHGAALEDGTPAAAGSEPADEPNPPANAMVDLQAAKDEPEPAAAAAAQAAAQNGHAEIQPSSDNEEVPASGGLVLPSTGLEPEELSDAARTDASPRQQKRNSPDAAVSSGQPAGSGGEGASISPQPAKAPTAAALQRDAAGHHPAALAQAALSEPAGGAAQQVGHSLYMTV